MVYGICLLQFSSFLAHSVTRSTAAFCIIFIYYCNNILLYEHITLKNDTNFDSCLYLYFIIFIFYCVTNFFALLLYLFIYKWKHLYTCTNGSLDNHFYQIVMQQIWVVQSAVYVYACSLNIKKYTFARKIL